MQIVSQVLLVPPSRRAFQFLFRLADRTYVNNQSLSGHNGMFDSQGEYNPSGEDQCCPSVCHRRRNLNFQLKLFFCRALMLLHLGNTQLKDKQSKSDTNGMENKDTKRWVAKGGKDGWMDALCCSFTSMVISRTVRPTTRSVFCVKEEKRLKAVDLCVRWWFHFLIKRFPIQGTFANLQEGGHSMVFRWWFCTGINRRWTDLVMGNLVEGSVVPKDILFAINI